MNTSEYEAALEQLASELAEVEAMLQDISDAVSKFWAAVDKEKSN